MPTPALPRRTFLQQASLASAAALAFPYVSRAQAGASPNNKLNLAVVGCGGRGNAHVTAYNDENLVAFCDVDEARGAAAFKAHPNVKRFQDYRKMLDQVGNQIDAVSIATPDHMHYPVAMAAMALGKHVFVEKPIAHTVWEAREMARVAREKKLATQMGNQGHAGEGTRLLKEWLDAGVLGDVREVHSWTDRPIWPQGLGAPDHSKLMPVVPKTLDWDLWLGVAPAREFDPAYVPFNWRGYYDFGTGAVGDMACHQLDAAYWALGLTQPVSIEATSAKASAISWPTASIITFQFAARGAQPPVTIKWYDGNLQPPRPPELEPERKLPENATLIVGTKATVLADANNFSIRIVNEAKMRDLAPTLPPKTLPRITGDHFAEWVRACKGGPAAGSSFNHSAALTETALLGCAAIRAGRRLDYDAQAMKFTNHAPANQFLKKEYRKGFGV
jgi:predicted dehydrogenase